MTPVCGPVLPSFRTSVTNFIFIIIIFLINCSSLPVSSRGTRYTFTCLYKKVCNDPSTQTFLTNQQSQYSNFLKTFLTLMDREGMLGNKNAFVHGSSATEFLDKKNGKFYKDHVITQSLP